MVAYQFFTYISTMAFSDSIMHEYVCIWDVASIVYSHTNTNTPSPHLRRKWKHFSTKHNNSSVKATVQADAQAWIAMETIWIREHFIPMPFLINICTEAAISFYTFWTQTCTEAKPWWLLWVTFFVYANLTSRGYQVLFRKYYSNAKNTTASLINKTIKCTVLWGG